MAKLAIIKTCIVLDKHKSCTRIVVIQFGAVTTITC